MKDTFTMSTAAKSAQPMTDLSRNRFFSASLAEVDPVLKASLDRELGRQQGQIELIASENIVSRAVLEAQGSVLEGELFRGPVRRFAQSHDLGVADRPAQWLQVVERRGGVDGPQRDCVVPDPGNHRPSRDRPWTSLRVNGDRTGEHDRDTNRHDEHS